MRSIATFFFFNDTATTEIYTLSLHDALPICSRRGRIPHIVAREGSPIGREGSRDDRRGESVSSAGWLNSLNAKRGDECDRRAGIEPAASLPVGEHNRARAQRQDGLDRGIRGDVPTV